MRNSRILIFSVMLALLIPAVPVPAQISRAAKPRKARPAKGMSLTGTEYVKPHTRKGKGVRGYVRRAPKRKSGNLF